MAKKLGLPEVRRRINAVIADRRDFVYDPQIHGEGYTCVYFKAGAPSCLVGYALEPELREAGVRPGTENNNEAIAQLAHRGVVALTKPAARYLSVIQENQDTGVQWGQAVESAERDRVRV